jgi:hypothetical protein
MTATVVKRLPVRGEITTEPAFERASAIVEALVTGGFGLDIGDIGGLLNKRHER